MERSLFFYILLFIISLASVLILTPLATLFARKKNIVDHPGKHKIHREARPLLGGLVIFICFAAIMFFFLPLEDKLISLVISSVILVSIGLFDDLFNLNPWVKLTGQTAAAFIVVFWNAHLFRFMIDYFANFYFPGVFVLLLIAGWVVLMINAFNLIDGMDGLAAGTAAIIFLAMAILSVIEGGRPNILGVQLIGAGACLGFLFFNFNPAKIFMGDTGSMLLGFILATTHLFTIKYPFSAQMVLGSMFILAYPALDVSYAIYRRLRKKTSIFKADQGHIHHVLLKFGFTVRNTAMVIYGLNIIFALIAIVMLSIELPTLSLFFIWIAAMLGVVIFFVFLLQASKKLGVPTRK